MWDISSRWLTVAWVTETCNLENSDNNIAQLLKSIEHGINKGNLTRPREWLFMFYDQCVWEGADGVFVL